LGLIAALQSTVFAFVVAVLKASWLAVLLFNHLVVAAQPLQQLCHCGGCAQGKLQAILHAARQRANALHSQPQQLIPTVLSSPFHRRRTRAGCPPHPAR
jgi:hypothetical protein